MKIAICDDEINIQFAVEGFIQKICSRRNIDVEIECFDSGDELCSKYEKGEYDIIFLDIEYKGKNGVEVGRFIREDMQDEIVQIAYISGNTGYALELFEYHPINFLVKPFKESDVERVIDKYLILSRQKVNIFQFKIRKDIYNIPLSEIIYFSSLARKITLHGRNEDFEFYDSLEKIYSQVKGKQFLYVHKSFIVNYQYIKKMGYEEIVLFDGTIIPISQARRPAISKQFMAIKQEEMK